MWKLENFDDFLTEMHAEQYCGLDDDMPEDCSDWICNLSVEELIEYADQYHIRQLQWYAQNAKKNISTL